MTPVEGLCGLEHQGAVGEHSARQALHAGFDEGEVEARQPARGEDVDVAVEDAQVVEEAESGGSQVRIGDPDEDVRGLMAVLAGGTKCLASQHSV
ncbi:hypothetical protein [Nocardioides sp.]|uniref:hypothetical protein n=1 Tax=Nocardioides sp. TaxID=35761 RepID=UPI00261770AE|nr:hypothetical protein [Nocardioides sp.]